MARNKLIAKYSALNTDDLPQRIYDKIHAYIETEGIEDLPYLLVSGRWTGKIDISNGGWHGDFDLVYRVIRMCRLDRHGNVYPDMLKIMECVIEWESFLTTPGEDDDCLGVSDETFCDSDYSSDEENEYRSKAFADEIDSYLEAYEPGAQNKAMSEKDSVISGDKESVKGNHLFVEGFDLSGIDSDDGIQDLMNTMNPETGEEEEYSWETPDFDMDDLESMYAQQEDEGPTWMEFIDDLRNGRYGELPEDYDGLALPDENDPTLP